MKSGSVLMWFLLLKVTFCFEKARFHLHFVFANKHFHPYYVHNHITQIPHVSFRESTRLQRALRLLFLIGLTLKFVTYSVRVVGRGSR